MLDKNGNSIWATLDFESVKRRINQINRWFEPLLSKYQPQSLEDLKDSQTKSSEIDISRQVNS